LTPIELVDMFASTNLEIARYGVMGSPALLIDGKVMPVGNVPPRGKAKKWLVDAKASLDAAINRRKHL